MFLDDSGPLDRWSNAKYSLEVFAAMMGEEDVLNVYLMSDFANGATVGPDVTVKGANPTSDRVAKIHSMKLKGGGTPYAPVVTAVKDLALSSASDKWLVILSDGEFNDRETPAVQADLEKYVSENRKEQSGLQVGFLAIGPEAPKIRNNPDAGVFFEHAAKTEDLLGKMTSFSNRIFARSLLPQSSPGQMNPDIDMDQLLVFAQGGKVSIGDLSAGGEKLRATSEVGVSWSKNPDVMSSGVAVPAVPNKGLKGELATFEDVPAGTSVVDVSGAQTVDVFYTPRVSFGIELRDGEGKKVEAEKIVGGEYTVNYGFMDRDCEFIESDLLGDVSYSAEVTQDGEVISEAFAPGDVIELSRGDAQFKVVADYLDGNSSEAVIDLRVLRPAKPTDFEVEDRSYRASELADYRLPDDGTRLHYAIHENGKSTDFSAEEWASFTPESFTVTSTEPDIGFEVELGDAPGEVLLLPTAPGDDPFRAATGEIPVKIEASHVYDEQLNEAVFDTTVTVEDDIPFWQRVLDWFLKVGWMWLLALLILIWILGYFFRRKLPRKMKARPLVDFRPRSLGGKRVQFDARYEKSRGRQLIPYLPETGLIRPPAQVRGVPALKVRAAGSGRMEVLNWKAFATNGKVSFDGEQLTKDTTKVRPLRGSSTITVAANDGDYDIQLGQTRSPGKR